MSHGWPTSTVGSEEEIFRVLLEMRGKRWLCRGQERRHDNLVPSIGRLSSSWSRLEMLSLERRSIELFRASARYFADAGEEPSLRDDLVALMVLWHYGVPTRLLDWSLSPHVAAYFAGCGYDDEDGEIWYFDHDRHASMGAEQWKRWPETCHEGDPRRFDLTLTAFLSDEPPGWFVCSFYPQGFARQRAQAGLYSVTARFGRDHAEAIAELLTDPSFYHLYVIDAAIKPMLRRILKEEWGVWQGSLYPDSAGAANTARSVFANDT